MDKSSLSRWLKQCIISDPQDAHRRLEEFLCDDCNENPDMLSHFKASWARALVKSRAFQSNKARDVEEDSNTLMKFLLEELCESDKSLVSSSSNQLKSLELSMNTNKTNNDEVSSGQLSSLVNIQANNANLLSEMKSCSLSNFQSHLLVSANQLSIQESVLQYRQWCRKIKTVYKTATEQLTLFVPVNAHYYGHPRLVSGSAKMTNTATADAAIAAVETVQYTDIDLTAVSGVRFNSSKSDAVWLLYDFLIQCSVLQESNLFPWVLHCEADSSTNNSVLSIENCSTIAPLSSLMSPSLQQYLYQHPLIIQLWSLQVINLLQFQLKSESRLQAECTISVADLGIRNNGRFIVGNIIVNEGKYPTEESLNSNSINSINSSNSRNAETLTILQRVLEGYFELMCNVLYLSRYVRIPIDTLLLSNNDTNSNSSNSSSSNSSSTRSHNIDAGPIFVSKNSTVCIVVVEHNNEICENICIAVEVISSKVNVDSLAASKSSAGTNADRRRDSKGNHKAKYTTGNSGTIDDHTDDDEDETSNNENVVCNVNLFHINNSNNNNNNNNTSKSNCSSNGVSVTGLISGQCWLKITVSTSSSGNTAVVNEKQLLIIVLPTPLTSSIGLTEITQRIDSSFIIPTNNNHNNNNASYKYWDCLSCQYFNKDTSDSINNNRNFEELEMLWKRYLQLNK